MSLRYLVAGTGRSGTAFISRALTLAGGRCGHESVLNHDRAGSRRRLRTNPEDLLGDSSLAAFAYLLEPELAEVPVLHLLRNPVDVVASWAATGILDDDSTPYGRFIRSELPDVKAGADSIARAVLYVNAATTAVTVRARGPYRTVRIEDLTAELLRELLPWLGTPAPPPAHLDQWLLELGRPNASTHPPLELEDLHPGLRGILTELAVRYGYDA